MAKILLLQYLDQPYQIDGSYNQWAARQHDYNFDTETKSVVYTSQLTYGGDEREFNTEDYVYPEDLSQSFYWDCEGTTKRQYYHNGQGEVTVQKTPNSLDCNWVPELDIEATVQHVICHGSNTGSISIQVNSLYPPYTYLWNDGATSKDRNALGAGNYTVTVTDSLGHASSKQIAVNQNTPIQVVGSIGGDSITLEVSGGLPPYTYRWNDGATTKDRSNVEAGTYTCTVSDSAGCSTEAVFRIVSERFFFSKNPVLLSLQAENYASKPNLRFVCEVWVEPVYLSGEFVLATPEPFEHPADKFGRTEFDVAEILDAFVEPHLPEFNQITVQRADKAFKRFYLRHTEAYGNPVRLDPFTVQDNRYVVYGGLDEPEYFANTYFRSFRQNRKPFFTWDPVVKSVFTDQPEYLYFMPDSPGLTDFRVKVKVTFTDGNISTIQPFVQEGIRRFELYAIPAGHDLLGLGALQPGKEVRNWEVYVVDGFNNVLSETRRFVVDTRHHEHIRYFLYANSIGGYNTLAATGKAKLTVDPQARLVERNRQQDATSGDTVIISKHSKRTMSMSTGHKSKAEMLALQDFLNSEDIKLVASDRYIPGTLGDKSATVSDDDETLHGILFDFILPKMHRYTPTLRLAGYTDSASLLKPLQP